MLVRNAVAIVLIAAGALGLIYRQVSYTTKTHEANVAGIELSMKERETLPIPIWASVGAIGVGVLLLVVSKPR